MCVIQVRDLRLALGEASANKIGSPVDQVLLFCFHYDPSRQIQPGHHQYGAAWRVLTAIGLVCMIGLLSLREKRKRRSEVQDLQPVILEPHRGPPYSPEGIGRI